MKVGMYETWSELFLPVVPTTCTFFIISIQLGLQFVQIKRMNDETFVSQEIFLLFEEYKDRTQNFDIKCQ